MARIDDEMVLSLEGDHFTVCKFVDGAGPPSSAVAEKLRTMVESAVGIVSDRIQSCGYKSRVEFLS